uniref:HTH_Tnp_Tc3_1 domain-containing protein n=1 Tax=Caenorhabditis japonica TaxID=281687 RepID=A0A8R1EQF8_CAEJA
MGLASALSSEKQAQLDIMIQLRFTTLQMRRRITRLRCCVKNYVRDTMAHGSAKPTGRPRILIDRDERSVLIDNELVFHEEDQSPCLTSQLARPQPHRECLGTFCPGSLSSRKAVSNCSRAQRCRVGQDPAIIPRVLLIAGTTDYSK